MTPNERATALYPLPANVIEAFDLEPGEFTHSRLRP